MHSDPKVKFLRARGRPLVAASPSVSTHSLFQQKPSCSFKALAQPAPRSAFTKPFNTAGELTLELAKDDFALCPGDFQGLLKACGNAFGIADRGYSSQNSG